MSVSPYSSHPLASLRIPPTEFLDRVSGLEQRMSIAGTQAQMWRSAIKEERMSYREQSSLRRMLRFRGTLLWNSFVTVVLVFFSTVLFTFSHVYGKQWIGLDKTPHELTITPIGFLLVFRSTLSYQRWWEGRALIGTMVFACRCITMKSLNYVTPGAGGDDRDVLEHCEKVMRLSLALVVATRHTVQKAALDEGSLSADEVDALRSLRFWELRHYLSEEQLDELRCAVPHPILLCRLLLAAAVEPGTEGSRVRYKWVTGVDHIVRHAEDLLKAWQGMMKIVSTPMPMPYRHSLLLFLTVWMFTLCFPLLSDPVNLGWATIPVCATVATLLFGVNAVGWEIEDPFGNDVNDFDLVKFQMGVHNEMVSLASIRFREPRDIWAPCDDDGATAERLRV